MDSTGLLEVKERIRGAASRAGVRADSVTLIAVSKGRSDEDVVSIVNDGQLVLGENRQQGLKSRIENQELSKVEWHFIGPLQRRKVAFVRRHISLLHSMDRFSLAESWVGGEVGRLGDGAGDVAVEGEVAGAGGAGLENVPVLIQFNMGGEPQKSGFDPRDADYVITRILESGVDVRGVMAIPPLTSEPEKTREHFRRLRTIFDCYSETYASVEHCSMGMTDDFEIAIEEGSTMIRVGRAIFEHTVH